MPVRTTRNFMWSSNQGRIRLLRDGAIVEQPFLDITDRVGQRGQ